MEGIEDPELVLDLLGRGPRPVEADLVAREGRRVLALVGLDDDHGLVPGRDVEQAVEQAQDALVRPLDVLQKPLVAATGRQLLRCGSAPVGVEAPRVVGHQDVSEDVRRPGPGGGVLERVELEQRVLAQVVEHAGQVGRALLGGSGRDIRLGQAPGARREQRRRELGTGAPAKDAIRFGVRRGRLPGAADVDVLVPEALERMRHGQALAERGVQRDDGIAADRLQPLVVEEVHAQRRDERHRGPEVVRPAVLGDREAAPLELVEERAVVEVVDLGQRLRARVAVEDEVVDVGTTLDLGGRGRDCGRGTFVGDRDDRHAERELPDPEQVDRDQQARGDVRGTREGPQPATAAPGEEQGRDRDRRVHRRELRAVAQLAAGQVPDVPEREEQDDEDARDHGPSCPAAKDRAPHEEQHGRATEGRAQRQPERIQGHLLDGVLGEQEQDGKRGEQERVERQRPTARGCARRLSRCA
jgi:hypothetical protein